MNIAKNKSTKDGKKFLQDAFSLEQKVLQTKLELSSQSITHSGVMGEVNESYFIEVLRKYMPRRYAVDTAIVIDSTGATSDQIDVVVYDNQYTPTLLDQERHRFVPAESVYAVFEVKPTINKEYLDYAADKAESVRKLTRTSIPIVHAGGEYPAKPLLPIVAGIVAANIDWADGFNSQSFKTNYGSLQNDHVLDCGLAVSAGCFDVFEGTIQMGPVNNGLVYFIFRFLKKLQSMGTVPAIDWNAYASVLGD
ncbi:MAG: hypothetical protein CMI11_02535 [Oceanospirillales bacterium]|mgnify:FL=1|nr:hypothetical protein [Oceanospirillales bacterium]